MYRLLAAIVVFLFVGASPAVAQCTGVPPLNQICAGAPSGGLTLGGWRALVNADMPGSGAGAGTVTSVTCGTGFTGGTITSSGTCAADEATNANIWAAASNKLMDAAGFNNSQNIIALTDAATITVDMSTFVNASVTLAGNRTLGNPTNTQAGREGCIYISQDATGSRTLAYSANWKFASGTAPVLTTTANALDVLCYQVLNSTFVFGSLTSNVK